VSHIVLESMMCKTCGCIIVHGGGSSQGYLFFQAAICIEVFSTPIRFLGPLCVQCFLICSGHGTCRRLQDFKMGEIF